MVERKTIVDKLVPYAEGQVNAVAVDTEAETANDVDSELQLPEFHLDDRQPVKGRHRAEDGPGAALEQRVAGWGSLGVAVVLAAQSICRAVLAAEAVRLSE